MKQIKYSKATPQMLQNQFKELLNISPPETNKIYQNQTPSPIRAIAEYEPMGGVLISYPGTLAPSSDHKQLPPCGPRDFGIPNELIIRMQQLDTNHPVHVFIFCDDENEKANIVAKLTQTAHETNLKFNPDLIHLIPWDTDTYWTRDYCPWWIKYNNTEKYGIAKHIYTSLGGGSVGLLEGAEHVTPRQGSGIFRCNDDYGAVKLSDYLNAPIRQWNNATWSNKETLTPISTHDWFFMGLLDVGGNYMVTSKGIIASSYLVAMQNELPIDIDPESQKPSEKTLNERMNYIMEQTNRFLGAHTYHVFTDPTGTYIGHIDCWGKFLSDDTVLLARTDDNQINAGLDQIQKAFENENFKVFRVLCPNIYIPNISDEPATTAPYTNSLILNDHVYVPIAGAPYEKADADALDVYRKAMPHHTIVGILGKENTPWLGTDALHCRTNAIPKQVVNNWLTSLRLN